MMAEGGKPFKSQGTVFHFHIHGGNVADESTVVQGDKVRNKTEIGNSNIETVLSGYPSANGNEGVGLVEGMREMNLERTISDRAAGRSLSEKGECQRRAYAHFQNGNYLEAREILDEINSSSDLEELDILLLIVECDLHLERSAHKCIGRLRDMILGFSTLKTRDVESWGDELKEIGRNVGSIILYWISSDKYKTEATDPNDSIVYMDGRATDILALAIVLAKSVCRSRVIVIDYIIGFLIEIYGNIRNAPGPNPDTKALVEGDCLNLIAYLCINVNEYQKTIHFGSMGIAVLEKQFGENASKYQNYGFLLRNVGTAYHNLHRYAEAETFYVKSVEAKAKAIDFGDENKKQQSIKRTKNDLAEARKKLMELK